MRRIMLVVAAFACQTNVWAQPSFNAQTVLADGFWNNPSSIAVDNSGVVHVASMKESGTTDSSKEIWYANNAGGVWTHTRITNDTVRQEFPALTVDAAGAVHIVFHTGTPPSGNKIQYVNNVGGSFGPPIDITGPGFVIAELAVGADGAVHFVFESQVLAGPSDIYYRVLSPTTGLGPLLNITNTLSADESTADIAVGPDGAVHIVYQRGGAFGGPLTYLKKTPGGSFVETPTGVVGNVEEPNVRVSSSGVVSIVYTTTPIVSSSLALVDDAGVGAFGPPTLLTTPGAFFPVFYDNFALDASGKRLLVFSSNVNTRGVFFIGETDTGFASPIELPSVNNTNFGVSVGVNSAGLLAVSYSNFTGTNQQGQVQADLYVATANLTPPCPADLDHNGLVNGGDLASLLIQWGGSGSADLNSDGVVNGADLASLLISWGPCP